MISKFTVLRLLAEASAIVVFRALLNYLTLFHDRGEDQVIDFLRPVPADLLQELFDPEQERVAGFWKVKEEDYTGEFLAHHWKRLLQLLQEESFLSKEDIAELQEVDPREILARFQLAQEKTVLFWNTTKGFRLEQRGRLDLAREYFRRMYHNALVVEQWAASQWFYQSRYGQKDEINARQVAIMKALRDKAKQFRMLVVVALAKTWLRCLVPFHETRFLPVPKIAALRNVFRHDLLASYEELKERALDLGRLSHEDFGQQVVLKM